MNPNPNPESDLNPNSTLSIVAVNVGNTRTALGLFQRGSLIRSERIQNSDRSGLVAAIRAAVTELDDDSEPSIVMASVNEAVADELAAALSAQKSCELFQIGEDLAVPIGTHLDPETITGVDRLLNAAAAWERMQGACVVVDAGTAVTVDFVDGTGIFQGGAIAPGAAMQLRSLHEGTAALPLLRFERPDHETFGKNTRQAMLQGVTFGIRGLVWRLVERYAEKYGAFPPVIATGGDAELVFAEDELVNRIVPDLTLLGIAAAARAAGRLEGG